MALSQWKAGAVAASPFHPYSMSIFCIFHSEVCVIPEWLLEVKGTESDANLQSMAASGRNKVILNKFVNARHDWVDCHIII